MGRHVQEKGLSSGQAKGNGKRICYTQRRDGAASQSPWFIHRGAKRSTCDMPGAVLDDRGTIENERVRGMCESP
ncbi:MAG TPA: hypothetical protein VL126_11670 [Bacteroidota bacterium]|nr:hypothetical protein [Bacteroidota bacterium]